MAETNDAGPEPVLAESQEESLSLDESVSPVVPPQTLEEADGSVAAPDALIERREPGSYEWFGPWTHADPGEETTIEAPAVAPDETFLVPGQKALLERDNLQLRERSREDKAAMDQWAAAFGIHDGRNPASAIKEFQAELERLRERNTQMQTVLGIGPDDDIMEATKRRNGEQVLGDEIFDGLPAVGHLLLMTKIGKLSGMGQYSGSPDQINDQKSPASSRS